MTIAQGRFTVEGSTPILIMVIVRYRFIRICTFLSEFGIGQVTTVTCPFLSMGAEHGRRPQGGQIGTGYDNRT
jgi:hypothetical protein